MSKFIKINLLSFYILVIMLALATHVYARSLALDEIGERLRNRIEASGIPPLITVGDELVYASIALPLFYEKRAYRIAWSNSNGPLPLADSLVSAIEKARFEGLKPENYHLAKIKDNLRKIRQNIKRGTVNQGRLVDLDLLLTDAFLIYGSHLLKGQVDPITIDSEWFTDLKQLDMTMVLENALQSKTIIQSLNSLLPSQSGYNRLRQALIDYRRIAEEGGWLEIPEGSKLTKGDNHERILNLRKRLMVTGDLVSSEQSNSSLFDDELEQAVKKFQKRHGLDVDGVVGSKTLEALNVSVQDRVTMIKLNMERWRWLPQNLGTRYILINIANFELDVIDGENTVLDMKVVVGKTYRRTPVFSDNMTYLVLCPYWNVPKNIAVSDILPQVKKDPHYLTNQNIDVIEGWGADMKVVDPSAIDWSEITEKNFYYRFRQNPGPANALGNVKFMFPNRFNVYIHDTPARGLFVKTSRDFSSGCIRIEKAIDLAEYVLKEDPRWSRENIMSAISKNSEQTIKLPNPIPIHILYWTAWVSANGTVNFRRDVYQRDYPLLLALNENPQD